MTIKRGTSGIGKNIESVKSFKIIDKKEIKVTQHVLNEVNPKDLIPTDRY
jgi:hypothetical protein